METKLPEELIAPFPRSLVQPEDRVVLLSAKKKVFKIFWRNDLLPPPRSLLQSEARDKNDFHDFDGVCHKPWDRHIDEFCLDVRFKDTDTHALLDTPLRQSESTPRPAARAHQRADAQLQAWEHSRPPPRCAAGRSRGTSGNDSASPFLTCGKDIHELPNGDSALGRCPWFLKNPLFGRDGGGSTRV